MKKWLSICLLNLLLQDFLLIKVEIKNLRSLILILRNWTKFFSVEQDPKMFDRIFLHNFLRMNLIHKVSSNCRIFLVHISCTVFKVSGFFPLSSTSSIFGVLSWGIMDHQVMNRLYRVLENPDIVCDTWYTCTHEHCSGVKAHTFHQIFKGFPKSLRAS